MFWDSVIGGLEVLTFWETYVAGLGYLLLYMVPTVSVIFAVESGGEEGSTKFGCIGLLVVSVFQVAAVAVFVLTLAPIILGLGDDAAWSFPWQIISTAPGIFLKLVGVLVVASIALEFVPFYGKSLNTLVLGGIALVFVVNLLRSVNPELASGELDVIPGFWFTAGLLIIGATMAWAGIMTAALLATAIGDVAEDVVYMFMFPIFSLIGFIPVFMYGVWLSNQLIPSSQ